MRAGNHFVEDPKAAGNGGADELQDPALESALRGFRENVHAWSEAVYQRPRTALSPTPRSVGRRAIAWALGCALTFGVIGTGVHEHQVRQEMARVAAQRQAEHQRELAAQQARETEELLAQIDKDVSREVPSAMDPLAQLMSDGDGK